VRRDGWQVVRGVVAELLAVHEDVLDADALLGDLALDSLQLMQLRLFLQDEGATVAADGLIGQSLGQVAELWAAAAASKSGSEAAAVERGPGPDNDDGDLAPVVSEAGVSIVPFVARRHLDFLYSLAVDPATGYRWRYRGEMISPERFQAEVNEQVLVQCVVVSNESSQPLGHVVAYQANFRSGHAHLGAAFMPALVGEGIGAVAVRMFVRYLFQVYPLRKLYLEVPEFNMDFVRSGLGRYLTPEGVLGGHDYYAGRYWDRHILAIYAAAVSGVDSRSG
jgi:RimJ/RimL family protein N-acetyltransferase/aryl carrier-like protein